MLKTCLESKFNYGGRQNLKSMLYLIMNYILLGITLTSVASLIFYIYLMRRVVRVLIKRNQELAETGLKVLEDYRLLNDQYRQLSNIATAFKKIETIKNSKKK
jgi:hypothetical protein